MRYIVEGGNKLCGSVRLQTAKNALLPMLAAGILTQSEVVFFEVPDITDVSAMLDALAFLGAKVCRTGETVSVNYEGVTDKMAAIGCEKMRASVFLLGAMLGRFRRAEIAKPGGCKIGSRPVDIHLDGFSRMGAECKEGENSVFVSAKKLSGAMIPLRMKSVGATENLMIAAATAEGETVIENAAREPEIVDLAGFLRAAGAKIRGAGTDRIVISGVKRLSGTTYFAMKDRVEAGTFLFSAMATGGEIEIDGCKIADLGGIPEIFRQSACKIRAKDDKILLRSKGRIQTTGRIVTAPFPGFPTDLQSPVLPVLCLAGSPTAVEERLFENRFLIVPELRKMGAKIEADSASAIVYPSVLTGARVSATDLRCGAGLVIAALAAEGQSVVENGAHILRGYDSFGKKLRALGANVKEEFS